MRKELESIVGLAPPQSKRRRLSGHERAAQFAPFAALTGFDEAIDETARITKERRDEDEALAAELDIALHEVLIREKEKPRVTVTYFLPDEKKTGGDYVTFSGQVRRVDLIESRMLFCDGTSIPLREITGIRQEENT